MPLPAESDLASQLFEAAAARSRQHGLKLQPVVTGQLRELATTGAKNILVAANTKPTDAQEAYARAAVRVATESMTALIDEMTSARFRLPNYLDSHSDSMGEQTLTAALSVLCPLWPFC